MDSYGWSYRWRLSRAAGVGMTLVAVTAGRGRDRQRAAHGCHGCACGRRVSVAGLGVGR